MDIEQTLNAASPEAALQQAKNWLEQSPTSPEAWQYYGLVCAKQNSMSEALKAFTQQLKYDPDNASCHINLSNVQLALGKFDQAQQHLHHALRLKPLHAETYNNLGRIFYKQQQFEPAITQFEKALRLDPNCWEAHYNLANTYAQQNQMHQAIPHYEESIRFCPSNQNAYLNLGLACVETEEYLKAEKYLRESFTFDPNNSETARQLGHVFLALGKSENALKAFNQAIKLDPNLTDAHHNLAILHLRDQSYDSALAHFQKAVTLDPNNATAKHMIAALEGNCDNIETPLDHITTLFDQYADYYNQHLKGKLNYNVPGLMRVAVGQCLSASPKAGRVLDLGCGTGLCGVVFRDLALELVGVDISSKMLAQAKTLDTYEQLVEMDIKNYLAQPMLLPFNIMIAGDVLVYHGDLTQLFEHISEKLLPDGLFTFSIEHSEQTPFTLQKSGRFAHAKSYIETLALQNELTILIQNEIALRESLGVATQGVLYVLKKK